MNGGGASTFWQVPRSPFTDIYNTHCSQERMVYNMINIVLNKVACVSMCNEEMDCKTSVAIVGCRTKIDKGSGDDLQNLH